MPGDIIFQPVFLRSPCLHVSVYFYTPGPSFVELSHLQNDVGSEIGLETNGASSLQFRVRMTYYLTRIRNSDSYPGIRDRYYGVILPCVLNLINMCGFCILNCILGGQTLASVADGNLSWSYVTLFIFAFGRFGTDCAQQRIGIVIIACISLLVSRF